MAKPIFSRNKLVNKMIHRILCISCTTRCFASWIKTISAINFYSPNEFFSESTLYMHYLNNKYIPLNTLIKNSKF